MRHIITLAIFATALAACDVTYQTAAPLDEVTAADLGAPK